MCGIAGLVGGGLDSGRLLAALAHRGPDHSGEFSADSSEGRIWLGATRLRISDPTPVADQPMTLDHLVIVFNGEIDNHAELRTQLDGPFRTRADTEVILRGYRKWGEGVVERLAGMFAFALWDGQRILIARDRLGIKPLWMTRKPFAFASEVRALLEAGVPASLDSAQISAYLATGAVPEPRSLVRGIEAFPPAHLGVYQNGELRMRRYWSPPPVRPCTEGEAIIRVRAPLQEAVRASLSADVPVALLLSGGVDSAALAAMAPENVEAFHLVQSGATSERARQAARKLPMHSIEISTDEARASLDAVLAAQDQPSPDGANVYLISRAIRARGIKAAVTGLGGDELFLGYLRHLAWLGTVHAPAPRLVRQIAAPLLPLTSWRSQKLLDIAAARGPVAAYDASRALFPAAAVRAFTLWGSEFQREESGDGEPTRLEMDGYLLNTLLRDGDVQSMVHGVELRVPYLDHRLVEGVLSLPLPLRRRHRKQLLAQAAGVPRALSSLPKEGFDLPLERWIPEAILPSGSELERVGLRPKPVAAVVDHFRRHPDRPTANRLWALVALVEWGRRHRASL
jgi:asparagine synthase (glutamine-hydrolysing)